MSNYVPLFDLDVITKPYPSPDPSLAIFGNKKCPRWGGDRVNESCTVRSRYLADTFLLVTQEKHPYLAC